MLIAQISDPHLTTGLLAAEPAAGLHRALGRVLALQPRPDCVVITGDLVDHGQPDEYAALRELIGRFPLPVHLAPATTTTGSRCSTRSEVRRGSAAASRPTTTSTTRRRRSWCSTHSSTAATPASSARSNSAGWTGCWADARGARPTLPAPPAGGGRHPAADSIRLADGDALAEVIGRHRHVVRVAAGHLHRPVTTAYAGTVLTVAPARGSRARSP
ncbi:metallophosphoesterase [Micromonospora sp. M12]